MPDKILFIDDDRYFARLYAESLKKDFTVVTCYDVDSAIRELTTSLDVCAAVVDVMMPPPEGYEGECSDGNTTGVWILEQCQEVIRNRRIALLVFTNLAPKYVQEEISFMTLDPKITEVCAKATVLAVELPDRVHALIGRR